MHRLIIDKGLMPELNISKGSENVVTMTRTFHPVGQGAFFTEQFYDEQLDKVLYNVVYDCGSTSAGIKTQMEREIRNCFHKRNKVDVLFLSHFDNDHINYVQYLKDKGYLQGTRIFIPMLAAEEWLGIEPYAKNRDAVLSLNDSNPGGTKVIQVEFDGGMNENDYRNDPRPIEDIEGGTTIQSGIPLTPGKALQGVFWCYTPFNVQFSELITEFKNKIKAEKLDYNLLRKEDYVHANESKLRRVYQSLGKKPSGGTAINLNSLLLVSYPMDPDGCDFMGCHRCHYHWFHFRPHYRSGYSGSCLYTGDTSANDSTVWCRIEQMIKNCLGKDEPIHLFQIPHHGSKHSYDKKLLDSQIFFNGFTNFDPYYRQHIFDENLLMQFAIKHKVLIIVTREYASRFEEYWRVRNY